MATAKGLPRVSVKFASLLILVCSCGFNRSIYPRHALDFRLYAGMDMSDAIFIDPAWVAQHGEEQLYALKSAGFQIVRNEAGAWTGWGNREDLPFETPRRNGAG